MRKTIIGFLIVCGLFFLSNPVAAENVPIYYNGELLTTPVPAEIDATSGRTVVPFRAIFEAMEYTITYNGLTSPIIASNETITIRLIIGAKKSVVNGAKKLMDVAPYVKNDSTLVPLRFVAENAGASVKWDSITRSVYIQYPAEEEEPVLIDGEQNFIGTATDTYLTGDIFAFFANGTNWYRGEVASGSLSGQGKYTTDTGTSYNGTWNQGKMTGQGRFYFSLGSGNHNLYEGVFENGEFVQGTFTYPDGSTYSGSWSNGVPCGQGTYTYPDGASVSGVWNQNGAITLSNATIK